MAPLVPVGALGVETASGTVTITLRAVDQLETNPSAWQRARAITWYDPDADHACGALVVPTAMKPVSLPSPQSIKYWIEWPRFDVDPPVVYV